MKNPFIPVFTVISLYCDYLVLTSSEVIDYSIQKRGEKNLCIHVALWVREKEKEKIMS